MNEWRNHTHTPSRSPAVLVLSTFEQQSAFETHPKLMDAWVDPALSGLLQMDLPNTFLCTLSVDILCSFGSRAQEVGETFTSSL